MEQFIAKLIEKTGVDQATAEKVFGFLKDNIDDVPGWLGLDPGKMIMDKVEDAAKDAGKFLEGVFEKAKDAVTPDKPNPPQS